MARALGLEGEGGQERDDPDGGGGVSCRATLDFSRSNLEIGADGAPVVSQDQPGFGGGPLICRQTWDGEMDGWADGGRIRMPKRFEFRAQESR